jgi:hypothetical protein
MGEGSEHIRLIKALIGELQRQGFEILCAASDGFEPCSEVENLVPDVKAYNRRKEFVIFGLAKTCDELDNEQTEEQFKFFSHRFMREGKSAKAGVPFCIAVSKGCEVQLDACLCKLKLDRKKNIFRFAF